MRSSFTLCFMGADSELEISGREVDREEPAGSAVVERKREQSEETFGFILTYGKGDGH